MMRVFGENRMFFKKRSHPPIVFRRDWGADATQPIRKWEVALDVITPNNFDCTLRVIYRDAGGYSVSIAVYSSIYFAPPIKATYHISLADEAFEELRKRGYILPFSLFTAPGRESKLWVVSDDGEAEWTRMI